MKKIKNAGKVIITMVMMLALAIPVFADAVVVGGGSHEIVIHKYMTPEEKWIDVKNDGTEQKTPVGSKPVRNVEFIIYSAVVIDENNEGSQTKEHYTLTKLKAGVTDSNGELRFTEIPEGLYYVEETKSATSTDVTSFFIRLPMRNPADGTPMTTVHVYPKNNMAAGTISKKVLDGEGASTNSIKASVEDVVNWLITAEIPGKFANVNAVKDTKDYYRIADDLDESLTYKSAVVKLGDANLAEKTDYTIEITNNKVVIEFTATGLGKLADALTGKNADITVELTTTINKRAYDRILDARDIDYVIKNQASYEWGVGGDNGGESIDPNDPDVPSVTVAGLLIYKTDKNAKPLAGVGFTVTNSDNPSASDYKQSDKKLTDSNGYAYWNLTELEESFETGQGKFYTRETAALEGYKILTGYKEFDELTSTNASAHITLMNYPSEGFSLPDTGGKGVMLYFAGLVLSGTGMVFILKSKKKCSK